ncbi:MAG: hypothetical protein M1828_005307 [Chrysothrix sp. TS-e1954]|nr:MAG: hypothetical protein M1828_005307 [Chrysothrix sp. TS-e1954]
MQYSLTVLAAALLQNANAFPTLALDQLNSRQTTGNQSPVPCTPVQPPFDAKSQYVSTSGKYKFVAPSASDARGPCPGLNAAANHGYLPHNGIATIQQYITGTYQVFGMAQDIAAFLAVYGAVFDGDLTSYSIGGPTANLPVISGLLGTPQGLSGSHNKYENDASPIRGDLYLYGNDYLSQVSNFQQLYDMEDGKADDEVNYGLNDIVEFRANRFQHSIDNNPYFFNGPFSGAIASGAAYSFIYRFMANKSAEYPEGRLSRQNLKDFYSMTGTSGNFKYTPGHEKIPENWYKRNDVDQYSIPYFTCDNANQILAHPEFASVGGNLGKTNSFVGLDPGNLTGGVYELSTLGEGNNAACFGFELGTEASPDLLEGLFTNVTPAKNAITAAFSKVTSALGCKPIQNLQYSQFSQYAGYTKSYNGYKGLGGGKKGIL